MSGMKSSIDGWVNMFSPLLRGGQINMLCAPYGSQIGHASPRG